MKKHCASLLMLAFAFSCKKKEKPQESTWTANGETFTAIATPTVGKAVVVLSSSDIANDFNIFFYRPGYFPTEGTWPIGDTASMVLQNPNYAYVQFHVGGVAYQISGFQNGSLKALRYNNEKAAFRLDPTWFVNYNDHSDSILISGDFYEPQ